MAEKTELDNSPHRVALDLATMISHEEKSAKGIGAKPGDRKYWLELYAQCRAVVFKDPAPMKINPDVFKQS